MSFNGARPKETNHSRSKKDENSEDRKRKTKRKTEEELREFDRHLSVRLDEGLDHVGASAELRKLCQDGSISTEIIRMLISQLKQKPSSGYFIFGSSSEGSTIPSLNSDKDVLMCFGFPVVENISEAGDGRSLLIIRDTHTQPGYVKLQLVYNRQPQTIYTRAIDFNRDNEEYDCAGRLCLKHMSVIKQHKELDTRNGPADTSTERNIDNVIGFRCLTASEFAREWIVRNRQYKWPPKRILDKMANMGCFVVGVGHPASKERAIEWRLSFSLQERELMFSMNMVQHKCYVTLKLVKKYLIEPIVGKSISSYHLKTCMYHAIENTMVCFWKRRNLANCVLLCMYVLFKWVYNGYCPNYFIIEENMFDRDIHRRQRVSLLRQIRFLLSHGCSFLFLIKLENIGVLLKNNYNYVQIESLLKEAHFKAKHSCNSYIILFKYELCNQANANNNAREFINKFMKYVSEIKSITDYNEQQTQKVFSYIIPYIHLQLAQSYASLALNTNNGEDKCEFLQKYGHHLRQGGHCDKSSSQLVKATVLFKLEQYESCISVLDRLEVDLKTQTFPLCGCYKSAKIHTYYTEDIRQLNTLPVSDLLYKISPCVTFLRSDMSITPEALQFEMFRSVNTPPGSRNFNHISNGLFDMAVVDAQLYLHFMQYIVNSKLNRRIHKQVAINKLELFLQYDINLAHRETGYNLLGWIHLQENWIPRAIRYFKKSWAIRPDNNAAKLHMLVLIRDINS